MGSEADFENSVRRRRRRVWRMRGLTAGGVALAIATVVVTGSLLSGGDSGKSHPIRKLPTPTKTVTPETVLPDAVRDGRSWPLVAAKRNHAGSHLGANDPIAWIDDAGDTEVGLVDIHYVASQARFVVDGHDVTGEWRISFAERWPGKSAIGPADGVVEYGVVVDTDGDRVADCHIGISDDAPQVHGYGDYRVWVTNLNSGTTKAQVGGPYGDPIDFVLPEESGEFVGFFFLTHGQPCNFNGPVHYYVYASALDVDGDVTARDFAPDAAWLEGLADEEL